MNLLNHLRRASDQRDVLPFIPPVGDVVSDAELDLKYRTALMLQSITQHVIGEYEAGVVSMPEGEDVDDYYVQALRLGQYAANLMESKRDPEYDFKSLPELMLPETVSPEHS